MIAHPVPERPWQKLGTDLWEIKGKNYLVVVDYYSKFIETALLSKKTAGTAIKQLQNRFSQDTKLQTSWYPTNPTYVQSNRMSEKAVQTVKRILKKANDPYIGLMEYRNTPITGMAYSPTQLLMGRIATTKIPTSKELPSGAKQQLAQRQKPQKFNYDKSTKPLPRLEKGKNVHLRQDDIWVPATKTGLVSTPRSYNITTPNGQQCRRIHHES